MIAGRFVIRQPKNSAIGAPPELSQALRGATNGYPPSEAPVAELRDVGSPLDDNADV
jgi:hypothetical protein